MNLFDNNGGGRGGVDNLCKLLVAICLIFVSNVAIMYGYIGLALSILHLQELKRKHCL